MELFVPYMLLLVWWHPDHPGQSEVERSQGLFATASECAEMGKDRVERVAMYHLEHNGMKVAYQCLQVPHPDEHDAAWQQHIKQRSERGQ